MHLVNAKAQNSSQKAIAITLALLLSIVLGIMVV